MSKHTVRNKVPDILQLRNDLFQMFKDAHADVAANLKDTTFEPDEWRPFRDELRSSLQIRGESWGPGTVRIVVNCPMDMYAIAEKWGDGMIKVLEPKVQSHPHFKCIYGNGTRGVVEYTDGSEVDSIIIQLVVPFDNRGIATMNGNGPGAPGDEGTAGEMCWRY